MEEVTYYARFDWGGTPKEPDGIVRRRVVDGVVYEEAFTRQLRWEPTEYFKLYRLGHDDDQYEEITKEEADAFIARTEKNLQQNPELRDVVTFSQSPADDDHSGESRNR